MLGKPPLSWNVVALVDCGDWACAYRQGDALSAVAHQLAGCVAQPVRGELELIAALSASDPHRASALWSRVAAQLRDEAPRRDAEVVAQKLA